MENIKIEIEAEKSALVEAFCSEQLPNLLVLPT